MDGSSVAFFFFVVTIFGLQFDFCGGTILSASSCTHLNEAIVRVNSGERVKEVQIPNGANIRMDLCGGMEKIRRSISISGKGSPSPMISGCRLHSLFHLSGERTRLALQNLVISSGRGINGGCVHITKSNKGHFSNVAFQNCSSTKSGGAIYTEGALSLTSVVFGNNTSEFNGGAVWSWNRLSIRNSTFTKNTAINGSAVYSKSRVDIQNSMFIQNFFSTTQPSRGVLYLRRRAFIYNATFFDNGNPNSVNYTEPWSSPKPIYHAGGAIWSSSTLIIQNSNFTGNQATDGGALYLHGRCSIVNSVFESNGSPYSDQLGMWIDLGSYPYEGGAIWTSSLLIIQNSFFTNNFDFNGGSIWTSGKLMIKNSRFVGNSAYSGGDVYSNSSTTNIQSSSFGGNFVGSYFGSVYGGSLYLFGPASVFNSSFTNCKMSARASEAWGGAIYSLAALNVSDSNFSNNQVSAENSAGGGAIFCGGTLVVLSSNFTENAVYCDFSALGGAIYSGSPFNISTLKFSHNEVHPEFAATSQGKDYYFP